MGLWQYRVFPISGQVDPHGTHTLQLLHEFGFNRIQTVRTSRIYTIAINEETSEAHYRQNMTRRIATELLADPVVETWEILEEGGVPPTTPETLRVEVHYKPGVMDNVANSALLALKDMGVAAAAVRTARAYLLSPAPADRDLGGILRLLGNECVEQVVVGPRPVAPALTPKAVSFRIRQVPIRGLDETALAQLSRDRHLFLSLEEMRCIQRHFDELARDPTDLEVETLAQTWSEHCVHKTFTSAIDYRGAPFPSSATVSAETCERRYDNLLKDTIARATQELIAQGRGPICLSVFKDNAGVIAFDDEYAVAFKVETHNHPSAIEPYGGSATGIGGVIRDVLGCGLGAKPVANTDVFCVAPPDWPLDAVPKGVIHPRSILKGIVSGVRDYGNRMGIPTINGAVHFDPRYLGNPLVYCGCVGLIPRDRIEKQARPGDVIIVIGGRTGRDGIHGATFSSAELTDTHVDEFAHAVQIGNAIEEKKVLDVILQARDYADEAVFGGTSRCLYSAITDCGAGGLSSAVGEMGAEIGAEVDLEKAPLKYAGLRYDEIWISEAQERMVLAVPPENVDTFLRLSAGEDVEATVIGRFTDSGRLVVRYAGTIVGDLDMRLLHHGVPKTRKHAEWRPVQRVPAPSASLQSPITNPQSLLDELQRRLGHPNTASKHWIIRQYDHEVQGRSVIKPLAGRFHGPSDAAVLRPRLESNRGIAIGCGLAPEWGDVDPYWMAVAAIDEALRNVVCVGGDPNRTAILDNFCWPRVDDPRSLGALVRACQGCYDAAKAYGLPFISGKDSLNNEFAMNDADAAGLRELFARRWPHLAERARSSIDAAAPEGPAAENRLAIPYTLLISAVSLIEDVKHCVSMDLKGGGSLLYLIGQPSSFTNEPSGGLPGFDLTAAAEVHCTVARLIREGLVHSVHDVSDGGVLTAAAEMALASGRSCRLDGHVRWAQGGGATGRSPRLLGGSGTHARRFCFEALPALYVVEAPTGHQADFEEALRGAPWMVLGAVAETGPEDSGFLEVGWSSTEAPKGRIALSDLRIVWTSPLDW